MKLDVDTVQEYLKAVPADRKEAFEKLRNVILKNLPKGLEETMSYGMIGYVVPHAIYPSGYHCNPELPLPFINIASQKNHIALYHSGIYADKNIYNWFVKEYPKHTNIKLDMGKSCVRFKKFEQIPFELISELMKKMNVEEWISLYEKNFKKR
ncbi:DUF1801 domain-containing protein [Galbibacter orientalis]|uniref:YdhG-like domain-containing protein n=1 Tax=Galbibacter orientalis DSM 19592 TaxID=926559 RepID=I3C2J3_9FLAO|nr:DUF1801 domain-containing protein [Galbibacter orientalis]EIJ37836.1 protein of unknown function (DU1801) [Galbibacter orientalis DSM 19592]